jgi:hypothetical protein
MGNAETRSFERWSGEPVYRLVSVVQRKSTSADHLNLLERPLHGRVRLSLEVLRPLHVGSGVLEIQRVPAEKLIGVMPGGAGSSVVIPGSSLKGAVRSLVEAISDSCFPAAHPHVRPHIPRSLSRCTRAESLCPACRIFGCQGWAARVQFADIVVPQDALVLESVPMLWQPARSPEALRARYLGASGVKGRKFYRHGRPARGPDLRQCIAAGTNLPGSFSFQHLTHGELGLVFAAVGLGGSVKPGPGEFPIKLGAGKPVGWGSVSVKILSIELMSETVAQTGRMGGVRPVASVHGFVLDCVREAVESGLVDVARWRELADALAARHLDTESPSRAY